LVTVANPHFAILVNIERSRYPIPTSMQILVGNESYTNQLLTLVVVGNIVHVTKLEGAVLIDDDG
jgi:hypothetical protein